MAGSSSIVRLPQPLAMRRGGVLHEVDVAYETWGRRRDDNVVLLFTGLSPDAHAASSAADPTPGWWEEMVGPGKAIDTERWHVVCVNSLGSCFGTTGPASADPVTGHPYRLGFPVLSIEDIADAAHAALAALGYRRLRAVAGCSLGGMSALAYALRHPGEVDALISVSSAARALPFAIAIRSLQREFIRNDPAWDGGRYPPHGGPIGGMRVARKLGMLSYRSAEEWKQRFGRARCQPLELAPPAGFGHQFEVEAYLEAHAQRFVGGFDPNCYLYLSRSMDLFDATEHGHDGSLASAFARLALREALVVGVETDMLFPIEQQAELAAALAAPGRRVEFARLACLQGHDSFLIDVPAFDGALRPFLARL
jgi:homoserine O-acetyltransferase